MPDVQVSKKDWSELKSYKYLLGDFGICMLEAIEKGARTGSAIMMLAGVPKACIKGRMPVLLNLNLVTEKKGKEYIITQKGIKFLEFSN